MAYNDTNYERLMNLLVHPRQNYRKLVPYISSKILPFKRDILEFLGIDTLSRPYPGHETLLNFLNWKDGFFVQCGGNDGYGYDPTYYLEKFRGWEGVIIEPLPISKLCKKNRRRSTVVRAACVPFGFNETELTLIDCNSMSFVKGSKKDPARWIEASEKAQNLTAREIKVSACAVQRIIDQYAADKKIGLFVADVEGYELQTIEGLDFVKNRPSFILLEARDQEALSKLIDFLIPKKYSLISEIGSKDFLFKDETA